MSVHRLPPIIPVGDLTAQTLLEGLKEAIAMLRVTHPGVTIDLESCPLCPALFVALPKQGQGFGLILGGGGDDTARLGVEALNTLVAAAASAGACSCVRCRS